jgi:hypothetical protein
MRKVHEIQAQLADTKAAVSRLEQAVASQPESSSLRVNLRTLLKRQRDLEQQLRKYQGAALPGTASIEVGPHPNE